MLSVKEAKQLLAQHISRTTVVELLLQDALNLVLAHDVKSNIHVPPFDNSAMDGYAFQYQPKKSHFKITQNIQAGDYSKKDITSEEAARIFTGAAIPKGCDTVIQQELCTISDGNISFDISKVKKGANIRLCGSQNNKGDLVVKAGTVIRPGVIGLLASVGITTIPVFSRPSVAIIVTGNELQENGSVLEDGHIYNSNEPALNAMLRSIDINDISSSWVKDDKAWLNERVHTYLENNDILILSGGISAGDYDFVRESLNHAGVEELFYKVKQKPGKPLLIGKKKNKLIFALPGNPAAVISCFYQYVKPSILAMIGFENTFFPDAVMPLADTISKKKGLTYFMKAKKVNGTLKVLPGQDSFNLLPFADADCFMAVDEEAEHLSLGTLMEIYNI